MEIFDYMGICEITHLTFSAFVIAQTDMLPGLNTIRFEYIEPAAVNW